MDNRNMMDKGLGIVRGSLYIEPVNMKRLVGAGLTYLASRRGY